MAVEISFKTFADAAGAVRQYGLYADFVRGDACASARGISTKR
jgi:hypothetical protein